MSELIVIEELDAIEVYNGGGLKSLIEEIRKQALVVGLDVEKKKDRDFMRSAAANVAKAKTKLDALGKSLTEEWKSKSKAVDSSRKSMREELDALRDEVRAPLTEYENREKERIAKIDATYDLIVNLGKVYCHETDTPLAISELSENLDRLNNEIIVDESLAEKELDCIKAKARSIKKLEETIRSIELAEKQAKELEELRIKQEKEEREERERKIAEDAAEKARQEAAELIVKQQEESDRKEREAAQALIDAENKARQEAEDAKAKQEAMVKQAEIDKQAAIDAEIARQKAAKEAEEAEAVAREANKAHKKKINNEAMQCFIDGGMSEEQAKIAVTLLAKREVKHCQINY